MKQPQLIKGESTEVFEDTDEYTITLQFCRHDATPTVHVHCTLKEKFTIALYKRLKMCYNVIHGKFGTQQLFTVIHKDDEDELRFASAFNFVPLYELQGGALLMRTV